MGSDPYSGRHIVEARLPGYTVAEEPVEVVEGQVAVVTLQLFPVAGLGDIDVVTGYSLIGDSATSGVALGSEQIGRIPHFGDDLYRVIGVLPGVTSNGASSQFNIRGGLARESLVELDRQELSEPFHLKEFDGVFSIVDPKAVGGMDLLPGGQAERPGGQECEAGGIVRRTVEAHRHRLAGKPVEVRLDLAIWELTVRAPASVLGSVLGNLVTNAFEHVERGEVTIGTAPGAIFVEDTGAGIATDLLGDVRHPFVRGDSSSGHGLGLAIIEELCQRFGWTLSLASDGSRGTRAQIELGESVVTARPAKDGGPGESSPA